MVTFPKYGKIKPVPNYQPGFYCIINFVGFYCGIFLGFTNTVWSSISWVCMRKPSKNAAISVEKSSRYYLWGMWREPVAGCRTVVTPPLIKLYCKLMLSKHGDLGQSQYVTVELMMTMPKNILPASQVFFGTPLEFDQMATGKTPEKLDTHSIRTATRTALGSVVWKSPIIPPNQQNPSLQVTSIHIIVEGILMNTQHQVDQGSFPPLMADHRDNMVEMIEP